MHWGWAWGLEWGLESGLELELELASELGSGWESQSAPGWESQLAMAKALMPQPEQTTGIASPVRGGPSCEGRKGTS
jgi:hypothetical protein